MRQRSAGLSIAHRGIVLIEEMSHGARIVIESENELSRVVRPDGTVEDLQEFIRQDHSG